MTDALMFLLICFGGLALFFGGPSGWNGVCEAFVCFIAMGIFGLLIALLGVVFWFAVGGVFVGIIMGIIWLVEHFPAIKPLFDVVFFIIALCIHYWWLALCLLIAGVNLHAYFIGDWD